MDNFILRGRVKTFETLRDRVWSEGGVLFGVEFDGEEAFEIVKVHGIELSETLHPDGCGPQRVGVQLAPDHAAAPFAGDEAGISQHGQVFGDCRKRHLKRLSHIGDGHVIFQKHGQDRPAGRVGEGGESGIERQGHAVKMNGRRTIVNRLVEYAQCHRAGYPGQWCENK